jgi:hypothetical protein
MLTPQPPLDMAVDKTAKLGITIALAGIVAVALILSLIDWFRTGRPVVLSLIYYGCQPLLLGKFPLWWMAVNAAIPLVLAALIYRFDSYFRDWRTLAVIPLALTTSPR